MEAPDCHAVVRAWGESCLHAKGAPLPPPAPWDPDPTFTPKHILIILFFWGSDGNSNSINKHSSSDSGDSHDNNNLVEREEIMDSITLEGLKCLNYRLQAGWFHCHQNDYLCLKKALPELISGYLRKELMVQSDELLNGSWNTTGPE